ncbi:hypothetical protein [Paludibacter sp. 221]|uniref:hypothetical protein n=1 Tax=Paludibacter sp. 221 TaxID=2302939 RepID=UPI0013D0B66B|nr:hypothetical protein [Paludibacter sp. 221]
MNVGCVALCFVKSIVLEMVLRRMYRSAVHAPLLFSIGMELFRIAAFSPLYG